MNIPTVPSMSDLHQTYLRYERWVLDIAGRPTSAILFTVYVCLVLSLLPGMKHHLRSIHAFFAFCVANISIWGYFLFLADRLSERWQLHVFLFCLHGLVITGLWLVISLFGKYVLGWEDADVLAYQNGDA